MVYAIVAVISLAVWQAVSAMTIPIFLPGPLLVAAKGAELVQSGRLLQDVQASYLRILAGWLIGSIIAVPIGLAAGRMWVVRTAITPYVNFFRSIPPIAFIGLAITWLGIGETSKIALITYTAGFIVFLNVLTGAQSVQPERIRAARCLGASPLRVLTSVVVPSTIPHMVTGLRIAMGTCFMTVIAAELVAAETGVGFLIWNSRLFAQTDAAFVGIVILGLMGFSADLLLRAMLSRLAHRYEIHF